MKRACMKTWTGEMSGRQLRAQNYEACCGQRTRRKGSVTFLVTHIIAKHLQQLFFHHYKDRGDFVGISAEGKNSKDMFHYSISKLPRQFVFSKSDAVNTTCTNNKHPQRIYFGFWKHKAGKLDHCIHTEKPHTRKYLNEFTLSRSSSKTPLWEATVTKSVLPKTLQLRSPVVGHAQTGCEINNVARFNTGVRNGLNVEQSCTQNRSVFTAANAS